MLLLGGGVLSVLEVFGCRAVDVASAINSLAKDVLYSEPEIDIGAQQIGVGRYLLQARRAAVVACAGQSGGPKAPSQALGATPSVRSFSTPGDLTYADSTPLCTLQ